MNINLKVTHSTPDHKMLCFKCAVKEALKEEEVDVEVDDYSSEYDTRSTKCEICGRYI